MWRLVVHEATRIAEVLKHAHGFAFAQPENTYLILLVSISRVVCCH